MLSYHNQKDGGAVPSIKQNKGCNRLLRRKFEIFRLLLFADFNDYQQETIGMDELCINTEVGFADAGVAEELLARAG